MQAGFKSVPIRVHAGMDATGYLGRMSPLTGVHDEPRVKCVILFDGRTKLAFITCDLLGLDPAFAGKTAARVSDATGIPAPHIALSCTHTHSGPASIHLENCGRVDPSWLSSLGDTVVACAAAADREYRPAVLRYKIGECGAALNRVVPESATVLRDTQVSALEILDPAYQNVLAVMINYACHPVTLTEPNTLCSCDYVYYLEEALRRAVSPDLFVMFLSGCCGDLNPVLRGGFAEAEATGGQVAASVLAAVETLSERDFEGAAFSADAFKLSVQLDYPRKREHFQALRDEYDRQAAELEEKKDGSRRVEAKVLRAMSAWSGAMLRSWDDGLIPGAVEAEIKILRIGKLAAVTLPFEVFHETGRGIKEILGARSTLVIGYAGTFGYLPSEALYDRACYESGSAHKYYGYPGPFHKSAESVVLRGIRDFSERYESAGGSVAERFGGNAPRKRKRNAVRIRLQDPVVVAQAKEETKKWGPWQFPSIEINDDRQLYVSYHINDDSITAYGKPVGHALSRDLGRTWEDTDSEGFGLLLPGGDRIKAHAEPSVDVREIEGRRPIASFTDYGARLDYYLPGDLPDGVGDWFIKRKRGGAGRFEVEKIRVDAPDVLMFATGGLLARNFFWGGPKLMPDGSVCALYYGRRMADGAARAYGSAGVIVSRDGGHVWEYTGDIPYEADDRYDPFAKKRFGFTEPDVTALPDGSALCLMRTTDHCGVGPLYWSKSADHMKTWSRPEFFDSLGVFPQLLTLACGVTLASYGRPGVYMRATADPAGLEWDEPAEILSPNAKTCAYTAMAPLDDRSAVLIYTDFNYPNELGQARKTILSRIVAVE